MQRIAKDSHSPVFYQFDVWQKAPLKHGVFTRLGGVSPVPWGSLNVGGTVGDSLAHVLENTRRMYEALDLAQAYSCTVWQVHGVDTVMASGPVPQRKWLSRADAMITDRVGLTLSMRFADCVPILFYDPEHHALGMAHAGWRGTVDAIVLSVIEAMRNAYETRPSELQVAIGPSIGPERYQVGEEVVAAVEARFGTSEALIKWAEDGSAYLNLWESNRRLLAQAGVAQIEVAEICTASHTDEFFSHRAEKGQTGRFGMLACLAEN